VSATPPVVIIGATDGFILAYSVHVSHDDSFTDDFHGFAMTLWGAERKGARALRLHLRLQKLKDEREKRIAGL